MGYRKYVNDYDKVYVIKPNGKPGVTAVYKGKYFRFSADGATLKRAKISLGCLSIVAAVLSVIPFLYESVGSHTLYVALPHAVSMFPLVHLLMGVYRFCFCEPHMIREHKDKAQGRTVASAAVSMCLLGTVAIAQAVNCILAGFPLPDVIYFVLLFVACVATGIIFFSRKLLKTEECNECDEKNST